MIKTIIKAELLFEITDVFGKRIRITRNYWEKIKTEKHTELKMGYQEVIDTLIGPDEVYLSVRDNYIRLFYKQFGTDTMVVLVKYLNGDGFVVTVYQTTKIKRKGEKLWPI